MKKVWLLFALMLVLLPLAASAEGGTIDVRLDADFLYDQARGTVPYINQQRTNNEKSWYWNSDNTTKTTVLNLKALTYDAGRGEFCSRDADWAVGAPDFGFLFPAFEERAANIYQALYYTRDTGDTHEDFVDAVFHVQPPMAAEVQKETFHALLQTTLQDECSYEVMQAVHDQVMEKMEEQKADKHAEPAKITKYDVTDALAECGVSAARMEAFNESYDRAFGERARLDAVNIASPRQFEVRTPSVVVKVNSDRSDLVETRIIDGHPYILIRADDGVEVNGVNVKV